MNILRKLTATATTEPWRETPIYHHTVGMDLGQGAFRTIRLGPNDIIVSDGTTTVVLPTDEILRLTEPFFAAPPATSHAPA